MSQQFIDEAGHEHGAS